MLTHKEWSIEGRRLFGDDIMKWKFKCPSCGRVISIQEYKDAKTPEGAIAFSCIGRYDGHMNIDAFGHEGKGCNYAGCGLIRINPVKIESDYYFEFAV